MHWLNADQSQTLVSYTVRIEELRSFIVRAGGILWRWKLHHFIHRMFECYICWLVKVLTVLVTVLFFRSRSVTENLTASSHSHMSADSIAISLLKKFSEKQLPKASELVWLVSAEDAPQEVSCGCTLIVISWISDCFGLTWFDSVYAIHRIRSLCLWKRLLLSKYFCAELIQVYEGKIHFHNELLSYDALTVSDVDFVAHARQVTTTSCCP